MKRLPLLLVLCSCLLLAIPVSAFHVQTGSPYTFNFNTPQPVEINNNGVSSSNPSAVQATDGTIWVAWQYYLDKPVYATYKSGTWTNNQTLPTGYAYSDSPEFGQLLNSSIILIWTSNQTGHWNLYYRMNSGGVWRGIMQLTSGSFDDYFPSVAVTSNSTVFVFWQRNLSASSIMIYYKTLRANTWSSDVQLTSGAYQDLSPSAISSYDGMVRVVWSRTISSTENDVYYRVYNGNSWSSETSLTTGNIDIQPSLAQDRNGTLLVFYSRQMSLGSQEYQQKLWYKYSYDGSSWSSDTQLTFYGDSTTPLDDYEPSVVQGADQTLWVFYTSDYPLGTTYNIFYIKSNAITPVHNAIISQVQAGPSIQQKNTATVAVTISNLGDYAETISLTVTATNGTTYTIASSVSENVAAGATTTFTFAWTTTTVPVAKYTILASYPRITGQSMLASGGDTLQYKFLTLLAPPMTVKGCGHMHFNCPAW